MVQGRLVYIVARTPRRKGSKPGRVPTASRPSRSSAVYSGWTGIPSGVVQVSASRSPLTSFAASASQSDRVGRSLSPMHERVRPPVPGGEAGRVASAGPRELLGGGRLERLTGAGPTGPAHRARAGGQVPLAPRHRPAP